ncbi:MAG TPA: J domain-containing protein [Oligoflexus sp.]|uniref:J domain-containing protein n=1 Tax=Oligoflexus sp. TaxID=1971216 RepID=UPI002D3CF896|nr:J domain-containing protein [Oligoflexus sp.]HYX34473.1 J domain-containing protein [Oligoflexus sp.]
MIAALLQWMDIEQLFAVLVDSHQGHENVDLPMARPPAIPDQILLKKFVPAELYREAMQAGWMGVHALSFALRHRATQLQQIFHLSYQDVEPDLRQCLLESWQRARGQDVLPLFGFSPLGIYASSRRVGLCRAFDALSLAFCGQATSEIFCEPHAAEAFWLSIAGETQQAIMFRYYADLKNFSLYGEADLETMLGTFWKRYRIHSTEDLAQAMDYFGVRDVQELRDAGAADLRRKFLQLSLVHHPDRGGDDQNFVILQTHYQRLKHYLEAG